MPLMSGFNIGATVISIISIGYVNKFSDMSGLS